MKYDIVEHAREVNSLSETLRATERQFGKQRFADCYRRGRGNYKALLDEFIDKEHNLEQSKKQALRVYGAVRDYIESKQQLARNLLGRYTLTTTDRTAETVIRAIGLDEPLAADRIVKPLLAQDPKLFEDYGMGNSYLEDSELENMSWDDFHASYSVVGFVHGQILTRVLILPVTPPKTIPSIINEIQVCYSFGQMTAIHGLCRALIETALTDVCLRSGKLTPKQIADNYFFKDFPPSRRINWTLHGESRSEAFALYTATSRVIHGASEAEDTASIVRRSVALVEKLYSGHAPAMRSRNA
jgi:hypothetical protein